MTGFYATDFGTSKLTVADCDRIALENAGYVGGTSYGYACPSRDIETARIGDWGFALVGTRGMGNCGVAVLRPRSRRTAELLREGRARALADRGYDLDRARRVVAAAHAARCRFALEDGVLEDVLRIWDLGAAAIIALAQAPGVGGGLARYLCRHGLGAYFSSCPRAEAGAEIARQLVSQPSA